MTVTIRQATSAADYDAFGRLCRAYVDWCRRRYQDIPWFVEEVFGYQSLDDELNILAAKYGPPAGRTLLAELGGAVVAGGAFRTLSDGICELKRLYVSDAAMGHGIGRRLSLALMDQTRQDGFHTMRLDTGTLLTEAISMYTSLGFAVCPPYHIYPDRLMPYLIFMEKTL